MADLSKLSDADLEAVAGGDLSKVSDEGLAHLSGETEAAPQQPEGNPLTALFHPDQRAAWQKWNTDNNAYMDAHPDKRPKPIDGEVPAVLPMGALSALPGVVGKLGGAYEAATGALNATRSGRIGLNTASGAIQGGLRDPREGETRLGNTGMGAFRGFGAGVTGEAIGQLASTPQWASRTAGQVMTGATPEQAKAFAENPDLAYEMQDKLRHNPTEFAQQAERETKSALGKAQQSYIDPRVQELNQRAAGLNVRVQPDQFNGTAAGTEIERSYNANPTQKGFDVPLYEPHTTQVTPLKPNNTVGAAGEDQAIPIPAEAQWNIHERGPTTQLSPIDRSLDRTAQPQTLEDMLIPRGNGQGKAPETFASQSEVSLTGPQALSAKRAASEAANINQSKNPMGYRASDDAEMAAAGKLRSALRAADEQAAQRSSPTGEIPAGRQGLADIDSEVERALRISRGVKTNPNPSSIYNTGETIGSVPTRQAQEFLDANGGGNFVQQSKALDAGQQVYAPQQGLKAVTKWGGRGLLRASESAPLKGLKGLGDILKNASLRDALLRRTNKDE